ncbi:hypothetical protein F7734_44780 [Scytonema sp. UIC 10036]|uniref:hypothetical protein n=1 Tax=Scytonema sp. UIC 10036 TaxID=2304196 RepID=UPI0012DA3AB8|nr:hypothetical protein [Scytonema sp. UIC 10036]MUG99035.1 hypothetical protein [Scytonema sp. UIC 10036]
MRFSQLAAFGCAAAIVVSVAPMQAKASIFQVKSGITSVYHDLSFLSSIGLDLTGTNNTTKPINDNFLVAFNIAPTTNFTFSDTNGLTPLSGTIEHTGTVTFNNQITIGNFSIGFDPKRATNNASGLFLKDTVSLNTILFDLSAPETVALDNKDLTLTSVELLFSSEFASILGNPNLIGVVGGLAQVNASVIPSISVGSNVVSPVEIPEAASVLAILTASAAFLASKRGITV